MDASDKQLEVKTSADVIQRPTVIAKPWRVAALIERDGKKFFKKRKKQKLIQTLDEIDNNDIFPLDLSVDTQKYLQCVADTDITLENPLHFVEKPVLLKHLEDHLEASEFHPLEREIREYPQMYILLVYDPLKAHEKMYFLCLKEDTKFQIMLALEKRGKPTGFVVDDDVGKLGPSFKEWRCQGADLEISMEAPVKKRELFRFKVEKTVLEKRRPVNFVDKILEDIECISIVESTEFIPRKVLHKGCQDLRVKQDIGCQTHYVYPKNKCTQVEKVEKINEPGTDGEWNDISDFLLDVTQTVHASLQQSEIHRDPFEDDFAKLVLWKWVDPDQKKSEFREIITLIDIRNTKHKNVSCIQWHPEIPGVLGVSYIDKGNPLEQISNQSRKMLTPTVISIWNLDNRFTPQLLLDAPDDITKFQFNPTDPTIIAGGCFNGLMTLWDFSRSVKDLHVESDSEREMRELAEEEAKRQGTDESDSPEASASDLQKDDDDLLEKSPVFHSSAISPILAAPSKPLLDLVWVSPHIEFSRNGETALVNTPSSQGAPQLITCQAEGNLYIWDTRSDKNRRRNEGEPQVHPLTSVYLRHFPNRFFFINNRWSPFYRALVFTTSLGPKRLLRLYRIMMWQSSSNPRLSLEVEEPFELDGDESQEETTVATPSKKKQPFDEGSLIGASDYGDVFTINTNSFTVEEKYNELILNANVFHLYHQSGILGMTRSPFYEDLILVAGGRMLTLWSRALQNEMPLCTWPTTHQVTSCCWSRTRPGVFFVATANGWVQVWDLIDRTTGHMMDYRHCSGAIRCLELCTMPFKTMEVLAISSPDSQIGIVSIPEIAIIQRPYEPNIMDEFVLREKKRRIQIFKRRRRAGKSMESSLSPEELEFLLSLGMGRRQRSEEKHVEMSPLEKEILEHIYQQFQGEFGVLSDGLSEILEGKTTREEFLEISSLHLFQEEILESDSDIALPTTT